MLDVVGAVDSAAHRRMLRSESLGPCLYRRLALLRRMVTLVLDRTTIAELAGTPPDANDERPPVSIDELLAQAIEAWDRALAGVSADDGRERSSDAPRRGGPAAADLRQTGKRLDL